MTPAAPHILPVPPAAPPALRRRVLYPARSIEDCAYPEDAEALHFGAHSGGPLVGVASLKRQPCPAPDFSQDASWRIYAVAVDEGFQGQGLGTALIEACLRYAADAGARCLWCNARLPADGFYEGLGFERQGAVFQKPDLDARLVVMVRRVGKR